MTDSNGLGGFCSSTRVVCCGFETLKVSCKRPAKKRVSTPVFHRALQPIAAAQVFRCRIESEAVAFEELCVILLRHVRRERASLHRGEQIGRQILAQPGSLIAQIDLARIAQRIVTVSEEEV